MYVLTYSDGVMMSFSMLYIWIQEVNRIIGFQQIQVQCGIQHTLGLLVPT